MHVAANLEQDKDKRLEDADDLCPSVCSEKFSVCAGSADLAPGASKFPRESLARSPGRYSEASNVSRLTQPGPRRH